jgi:hypothetical protein
MLPSGPYQRFPPRGLRRERNLHHSSFVIHIERPSFCRMRAFGMRITMAKGFCGRYRAPQHEDLMLRVLHHVALEFNRSHARPLRYSLRAAVG